MKNLIDLTITEIKTDTFSGEIFASELGVDLPGGDDTLNFEGYYSVEWDGDLPQVIIEGVDVHFKKSDFEISLNRLKVAELSEWIEQNGPQLDWLADRQAALSDYYYDAYRDGLFD